jgi:hypothetical protein
MAGKRGQGFASSLGTTYGKAASRRASGGKGFLWAADIRCVAGNGRQFFSMRDMSSGRVKICQSHKREVFGSAKASQESIQISCICMKIRLMP